MSRVRWFVTLLMIGALGAAFACGSSARPPADREAQPAAASTDLPASPTQGDAATGGGATAYPANYYYPGCDPTEITDGAVGNCACFAPDSPDGTDASADPGQQGITIELACGFEHGLCSSLNDAMTFCSPARQGVYFPGCPNVFTGPDGSANIPPCPPGTKPVPL